LFYNEVMSFTWNLFILAFFAVFTVYGLLLGRNRILGILINLYPGLVVAEVAGETVHNFLSHFRVISNNLATSLFGTKLLLLILVTFLLTIKGEHSKSEVSGMLSSFQTALYGFLTAGLLLSSALSFMSESEKLSLFSNSNLANLIASYQIVWIVAPILCMIGTGFLKKS